MISNSLGIIEAISILIIITINKLILNIPYYIVNLTQTGSVINIIYIGIIDYILLLAILRLFDNFNNLDIIDVAEKLGGKILKLIISIISIILLLLVVFITLLDFSNVIHQIYFSNFSIIYIFLFFILAILIANLIGLKAIAKTSTFIIPFSIISIIITFLAVFKDIKFYTLTPILGKSYYSTFGLGITNSFSMYFIVYVYFMKPLLKNPKDFKKISITAYFISIILLLLTVISMLTLFNSGKDNSPINSLFLLTRQIQLGTFLQRVDALFILLWIMSMFTYLSLIINLINNIIKKNINISNNKMLSFSTCSILLGLVLIPFNISQINYTENIIYRYVILGFMFILGPIILILASILTRKKKGNS